MPKPQYTKKPLANAPRIERKDPEQLTLADLIDNLYRIKERRTALNRQSEELKVEEMLFQDLIIKALQGRQATAAQGKVARAELRLKMVPTVVDWDTLYEHITKTQSWDLIHRRVTETAVRARWEQGDNVPGVDRTDVWAISLTKAKELSNGPKAKSR